MLIGTSTWLGNETPERNSAAFETRLDRYDGWDKYNMHYWQSNYRDFTEFFVDRIFSEPIRPSSGKTESVGRMKPRGRFSSPRS
ncbi:MAG: hypothetical protein ACR2NT_09130 [Acidimicrobiia bacterium]